MKTIYNTDGEAFTVSSTKIEQEAGVTNRQRYVKLNDISKAFEHKGNGSTEDYSAKYAGTFTPLYTVNPTTLEVTDYDIAVTKTPGNRVVEIGCQKFTGNNAKVIITAVNRRAAAVAAASTARKNRR